MKKKILILSIFSFIFFAFILFTGISYAYASSTIASSKSSYLNLYKNGFYLDKVIISPLTESEGKYFPCNLNDYSESDINENYNKNQKIGFKINDEFYVNSVELTEDNIYTIEIYNYEVVNNIKKPVGKVPLENFKITLSNEYKPILQKENFYLNNYEDFDSFKQDLFSSFDTEDISFSLKESKRVESLFIENKTIINQDIKNNTNNFVKTPIKLTIVSKEKDFDFTINFCKLTDEEKNNFIDVDELSNTILSSNPLILSENTVKNFGLYNKDSNLFLNLININHFYDIKDGEIIYYNFNNFIINNQTSTSSEVTKNKINCSFNIANNLGYNSSPYPFTLSSYNFNNVISINGLKGEIELESNDFEIEYDSNTNLVISAFKKQIKNFYVYYKYNNIKYEDYSFYISDISIKDTNISFKKDGNVTFNITFTNYSGESFTEEFYKTYKIVENKNTKILQKYNYIILESLDDETYKEEQLRILYKNELYKLSDPIVKNVQYNINEKMQYITINITLNNDITLIKNIPYYIRIKQNGFKKFLISYGNFLRSIF